MTVSWLDPYFVIELDRDVRPIVCDKETWIHELENSWDVFVGASQKRPVHRYCRLERFRGVLNELIGMRGKVDQEVIDELEFVVGYVFEGSTVWNVVRGWLKSQGLRKYYNRIPQIIFRLGYKVLEGYSWQKYLWILEDFEKMHKKFERKEGLTYFPNLRFICFKLMEKYGIRYTFIVPMVRTKRKQARLDILWLELNKDC